MYFKKVSFRGGLANHKTLKGKIIHSFNKHSLSSSNVPHPLWGWRGLGRAVLVSWNVDGTGAGGTKCLEKFTLIHTLT